MVALEGVVSMAGSRTVKLAGHAGTAAVSGPRGLESSVEFDLTATARAMTEKRHRGRYAATTQTDRALSRGMCMFGASCPSRGCVDVWS